MKMVKNEQGLEIVINEHGAEVIWEGASVIMDNEICEKLDTEMAPCSSQEFFDAYCKAHEEKYSEKFECAKANPVY